MDDLAVNRKRWLHNLLGCCVLGVLSLTTVALTRSFLSGNDRAGNKSLVSEPPVARVVATSPTQKTEVVSFTLTNRSPKPIALERVSSTCTCVAVGEVDGVSIAPGGNHRLSFEVKMPEAGISSTNIDVFHDGGPEPVGLRVEAVGHRSLPLLKAVRNGSPTFLALRSPSEEAQLLIQTREALDSVPWLIDLACEIEEAEITLVLMDETPQPSAGLIEREYIYRVTWRELPSSPEFRGAIWATTRLEEETPLSIGHLSGSLGNRRLFSPTVVLLEPERRPQDMVLFEPDTGVWSLSPEASLPSWLAFDWLTIDGNRRLILKLVVHPASEGARLTMPLVSDRGMQADLEVVMRPALEGR